MLTAAGAALIGACYGFARFAYGLFLPTFRRAFDLDAGAAGLIASSSYLAYCLGIILATVGTPRLGARRIAVAAAIVAGVGCAIIAAAPGAPMLAAGVAIAGASTGMASPPLAQAVSDLVRPGRRDRVQTVVNAGTGIGVIVAGPVALLVHEQWRWAWGGFAVASFAIGVWIAVVIDRDSVLRPGSTKNKRVKPRAPRGARSLWLASVAMGASSAAGWTFGQDFLQADGGHGAGVTTGAWIALGACGLLGALSGDLITKTSIRMAWRSLMLSLAAVLTAWALLVENAVVAVTASALFGTLYIALTGVLLVWSTHLYPERQSKGVGQAFLAIALGQAVSSTILGSIADGTGMSSAFLVASAIAVAGMTVAPGRDLVRSSEKR